MLFYTVFPCFKLPDFIEIFFSFAESFFARLL